MIIKKTFDTGNKVLTTSAQQIEDIDIPMYGDVKRLMFEVIVDVAGTLSAQQKLSKAIQNIKLDNKNNKPLWRQMRGIDLRIFHLRGNRGKDPSETNVANASATDELVVPWRIDKKAGPLKLGFTLAPYSDLATGATGGNCQIKVTVWYDTDEADSVKLVETCERLLVSGIAGVNGVGHRLPKGDTVQATFFKVTTEGDVTDVTFARANENEVETLTRNQMIGGENADYESGHQTGIFEVPHSPYVVSEKTKLEFNLSAAEDIDIFLVKAEQAA